MGREKATAEKEEDLRVMWKMAAEWVERREGGRGRRRGWMSCLADSNLTAIREGRVRDLLAWGGGWWCWCFGGCNGGAGVM